MNVLNKVIDPTREPYWELCREVNGKIGKEIDYETCPCNLCGFADNSGRDELSCDCDVEEIRENPDCYGMGMFDCPEFVLYIKITPLVAARDLLLAMVQEWEEAEDAYSDLEPPTAFATILCCGIVLGIGMAQPLECPACHRRWKVAAAIEKV